MVVISIKPILKKSVVLIFPSAIIIQMSEREELEFCCLGIDFGVTKSCVAVWRGEEIETVTNDLNRRIIPSCFAFVDKKEYFGSEAETFAQKAPESIIYGLKYLVNDSSRIKLLPEHLTVNKILSMYFKHIKDISEKRLEFQATKAVITVPTLFTHSEKQIIKKAAEGAGFQVVSTLDDTIAAMTAYGLNKRAIEKTKNVLIFDMGGRNCTTSIVTVTKESMNIKAIRLSPGGDSCTDILVKHFMNEIKTTCNVDVSTDTNTVSRLHIACNFLKHGVSSEQTVNTYLK
ncbi:heat shock cognate 71 kDa protein-like isoform 3, partial [Reticulomyxa filosa]